MPNILINFMVNLFPLKNFSERAKSLFTSFNVYAKAPLFPYPSPGFTMWANQNAWFFFIFVHPLGFDRFLTFTLI